MSVDWSFTKDNLDQCLNRLAKEFRKLNGTKTSAEIILIGGAAVLAGYGFREKTYDIDAIVHASSAMKEAINKVGDEYGYPNGWLNSDFVKTKSYSPKLLQYAKFYKRFEHVLDVRMITGEYLIAMKLMSGRPYKNDISDVVGILYEEQEKNNILTLEQIQVAVCNLYGSWERIPKDSIEFITGILQENRICDLYMQYRNAEQVTKEQLLKFEDNYPGVVNQDNMAEILRRLREKL